MTGWTLITGASEGLGAEFARIAARERRNLILTARSEDKLATLARELGASAGQIAVIPADLSHEQEVARLWEEASRGRRIEILVNNAGLARHGRFDGGEGRARDLDTIAVNVTALTLLMKHAVAHMQAAGGGRILNVASTAAFMPGPNRAIYHATKAYVLSLSEAVAEELRTSAVSVTVLCPGATQTAFFDAAGMEGVRLLKLTRPAAAPAVARAGWQAMMRGRRILVPGVMNRLFAFAPRLAPRGLVTRIAGAVMGKPGT